MFFLFRVNAIFFDTKAQRLEDTKFFVSRKVRKGAKTQGFFDTNTNVRIRDFFDTKSRRLEVTKFFVSRKARKGAKTQGFFDKTRMRVNAIFFDTKSRGSKARRKQYCKG